MVDSENHVSTSQHREGSQGQQPTLEKGVKRPTVDNKLLPSRPPLGDKLLGLLETPLASVHGIHRDRHNNVPRDVDAVNVQPLRRRCSLDFVERGIVQPQCLVDDGAQVARALVAQALRGKLPGDRLAE